MKLEKVLIESDWNLKDYRICDDPGTAERINRIRLEFKAGRRKCDPDGIAPY